MTDSLNFTVDVTSATPVYAQIENQVEFAVASGRLKPGDRLPSVRSVSEALHINQNTIGKAYRDLMLLGMVTSRRGVGVRIAEKASRIVQTRTKPMLEERLKEAVAECLAGGMKEDEIRRLVAEGCAGAVAPFTPKKAR